MNDLAHLHTVQHPSRPSPVKCCLLLWFWDIGKISLALIDWLALAPCLRRLRSEERGANMRAGGRGAGQGRKARCQLARCSNCNRKPHRIARKATACRHAHSKSFRVRRVFSVWHPLQTPTQCLGDVDKNAVPPREIAIPSRRQACIDLHPT